MFMLSAAFVPALPFSAHAAHVTFAPRRCLAQRHAPRLFRVRNCADPPPDSSSAPDDTRALPAGTGPARTSGKDIAFVGAERLGISFTCNASGCGERVTKSVRRRSYEKGTVLIQCPRCLKHHIIADNKGMYSQLTGGKKNVEEIAKATGTNFTRVTGEAFQLEKIYGDAENAKRSEEGSVDGGRPEL